MVSAVRPQSQEFIDNIYEASDADYVKATQRVFHAGATDSNIELPLVSAH